MSMPKQLVIGKSRIRTDVVKDVQEYLELKEEVSRLNRMIQERKDNIEGYMRTHNVDTITCEDKMVKIEPITRTATSSLYTSYDFHMVRDILSPGQLAKVSETVINRELLEAQIKTKAYTPEKIAQLEKAKNVTNTTQFVVRKVTKAKVK
ncbi:hypothetical protein EalM132_00143 [Exiguobacterium phage vB_EalM-132]|nr:hypothetical protein EalM132_00143 [Exiguobacterium phage vB_EalM-132]